MCEVLALAAPDRQGAKAGQSMDEETEIQVMRDVVKVSVLSVFRRVFRWWGWWGTRNGSLGPPKDKEMKW